MSSSAARVQVDLQRRVQAWLPAKGAIAEWATQALGRKAAGRELSVRVVGAAESRRLNSQFRGKDKPTNVLSFPTADIPAPQGDEAGERGARERSVPALPLGDLVICPQVLRAEAREQHKTLRAHWAHLVVHGTLHLIGYDHEKDADATRTERREVLVLRRLGFANPYRSP